MTVVDLVVGYYCYSSDGRCESCVCYTFCDSERRTKSVESLTITITITKMILDLKYRWSLPPLTLLSEMIFYGMYNLCPALTGGLA